MFFFQHSKRLNEREGLRNGLNDPTRVVHLISIYSISYLIIFLVSFRNDLLFLGWIMAASSSCFAIPLSSSRSSSNAIPKCKTLTSSCFYVASLKASTTSFHLSSLSRQRLQLKVFSSSSELSVLDEATQEAEEEEVKADRETGEETEAEPVVTKKPRPCELYVCNIPRSYDITQLLDMFQSFGTVISVEVKKNLTNFLSSHVSLCEWYWLKWWWCRYLEIQRLERAVEAVMSQWVLSTLPKTPLLLLMEM